MAEKNQALQSQRGISFEEVMACVENGGLFATLEHPNTERYENQKPWVARMRAYVYLVLFVEPDSEVFSKTIIPSRKASKQFLQGADDVPTVKSRYTSSAKWYGRSRTVGFVKRRPVAATRAAGIGRSALQADGRQRFGKESPGKYPYSSDGS